MTLMPLQIRFYDDICEELLGKYVHNDEAFNFIVGGNNNILHFVCWQSFVTTRLKVFDEKGPKILPAEFLKDLS